MLLNIKKDMVRCSIKKSILKNREPYAIHYQKLHEQVYLRLLNNGMTSEKSIFAELFHYDVVVRLISLDKVTAQNVIKWAILYAVALRC